MKKKKRCMDAHELMLHKQAVAFQHMTPEQIDEKLNETYQLGYEDGTENQPPKRQLRRLANN